jgi:DNA-directed RNA polymerase specialized sigma24 family protein
MNGDEFLEYAGLHYEENRNKWGKRLGKLGMTFSEDIFQDTLLKLYDHFNEFPYTGDIDGYWYQSFLNNTKRDARYSYHKRDDDVDVLKHLEEQPYEPPKVYGDLFKGLSEYEDNIDYHLFRIYVFNKVGYEELEQLTGVKDVRNKIRRIKMKLDDSFKDYYRD